ncbi:MAG TPA: hypothetical protein VK988_02110 [Acidimicrobiales bacterium]|nr:hypothetical protein [Acidimicrobiales bacterium]
MERRLGIPKGTVLYWATQRNLRTVRNQKTAEATEAAALDARAKRALVQCLLLDRALDALDRMDEVHKDFRGKDASSAVKDYAMTVAILIDKLRLEEGGVTARTEHLDPQQRAAEVLDQLAARRAKSTPPKTTL